MKTREQKCKDREDAGMCPCGQCRTCVELLGADIERLQARVAALEADEPKWIVNDIGELGVEIHAKMYFLYKGHSLEYREAKHDDLSPMLYRPVYKREFGEVCHPRDWWPLCDACMHVQCSYPDTYDVGDEWFPLPDQLSTTGRGA